MHFQTIEKENNCGEIDAIRQLLAIEICFSVDLHLFYPNYSKLSPHMIKALCKRYSVCVPKLKKAFTAYLIELNTFKVELPKKIIPRVDCSPGTAIQAKT